METPTSNTPVAKCLALATYACQMMTKYATTNVVLQELATKMAASRNKLASAEDAYSAAEANLLPIRVNVRFADHESDEGIKQRKRAAEFADGEAHGPYAVHLFPNGTTPLTRPFGAAQVKEMRDLEGRYDVLISRWPEAQAEKDKLSALRQRYEQALQERSDAEQSTANAKVARDSAKDDFLNVYSEVANRVRSLFPRNKKKQDLFFDTVVQRPAAENDVEEAVG